MENPGVENDGVPPHTQLIQMGMGFVVSRIVFAAAKLGLADRLADGPRSAEELAAPTGSDAASLYRLMRTLASLGILSEGENSRFSLTGLGEALKTGAPGSARSSLLTLSGQLAWRAWEEFPYSLETGRNGKPCHQPLLLLHDHGLCRTFLLLRGVRHGCRFALHEDHLRLADIQAHARREDRSRRRGALDERTAHTTGIVNGELAVAVGDAGVGPTHRRIV